MYNGLEAHAVVPIFKEPSASSSDFFIPEQDVANIRKITSGPGKLLCVTSDWAEYLNKYGVFEGRKAAIFRHISNKISDSAVFYIHQNISTDIAYTFRSLGIRNLYFIGPRSWLYYLYDYLDKVHLTMHDYQGKTPPFSEGTLSTYQQRLGGTMFERSLKLDVDFTLDAIEKTSDNILFNRYTKLVTQATSAAW